MHVLLFLAIIDQQAPAAHPTAISRAPCCTLIRREHASQCKNIHLSPVGKATRSCNRELSYVCGNMVKVACSTSET